MADFDKKRISKDYLLDYSKDVNIKPRNINQKLEWNNMIEYETICKCTTKYLLSQRKDKNKIIVLEYNAKMSISLTKI